MTPDLTPRSADARALARPAPASRAAPFARLDPPRSICLAPSAPRRAVGKGDFLGTTPGLLAVLATLLAPPPARSEQAAGPSGLAPTGTLRAVFLGGNPVQGRIDPNTGEATGPAPDLVRELARRLGVPFAIAGVPDAAAVIDRVKSGRADIGFLAYEAARAAQVDFSVPYLLMQNAYLVRADSPIRTSADVDRPGVTVAAVLGQSQQIWVSANLARARVRVLPQMPPDAKVVELLARGDIDAFAANRQRMEDAARGSPRVRVLPDDFLVVGQAIVVAKGSAQLAEVNRFVADVVASGFVKASIERARLGGVQVPPPTPPPARAPAGAARQRTADPRRPAG